MTRRQREQRGEHAPKLWSVWAAGPIVLALGGACAYLVFRWLHSAAVPTEVPGGRPRVDSLEVIQTTLTVLAFVGALMAGLYAYRKQRLAEGDATRADAQQFADRYTKAADQLGSDQAAIRLAGVYAMARLADDWKAQRQICVDVLCAYLRMPYPLPGEPEHRPGEDQVRKTIVSVIDAHLQSGVTPSWSTANLNFAGAHLEDASFTFAVFLGSSHFEKATFSGSTDFRWATFSRAEFRGATFTGSAQFWGARFSWPAEFEAVTFTGSAQFGGAVFSMDAEFGGATFSSSASFGEAMFLSSPKFRGATFSGSARFDKATFSHAPWFGEATFSGAETSFQGVVLDETASSAALSGARFGGPAVWGPFDPVPFSNPALS